MKLLFGATPKTSGRITLAHRELAFNSPRDAIAAGVVLCPEDRKKEGIIPILSVLENTNLSARRRQAAPASSSMRRGSRPTLASAPRSSA